MLGIQSRGACPARGLPELQPKGALAQHTHLGDTFHLGSVTLTAGPWRINLVTPSCWQAVGPAWQNFGDSNQHHPVTDGLCIYPPKAGSLVSFSNSTRPDEAYGSQIPGVLAQCFCPVWLCVTRGTLCCQKKKGKWAMKTLHWLLSFPES